jgi:predicted component of type VI protein secretion system
MLRFQWCCRTFAIPRYRHISGLSKGCHSSPRWQPFFFGTGTNFRALKSMDREMLMEHLSQTERHVADGSMHVERRRTLVENLARDGHDISKQAALLQQFEDLLAMHIQDREKNLDSRLASVTR